MRSYYGRPVIKEPVWQPEIPWYFFTGGLAGASSILSLVARLGGNEELARKSLYIGAAADVVSPVLLISDLGRPERFLNMFRVFKVTSPMSVGSWILLGLRRRFVDRRAARGDRATEAGQVPRRARGRAERRAALGLHGDARLPTRPSPSGTRRGTSCRSCSARALRRAPAPLRRWRLRPREAGPARRLAVGGAIVENVVMQAMEKRLGMLAEPYHEGEAGKYAKLAKACSLGGAALLGLAGRRSRAARSRGRRVAARRRSGAALVGLQGGLPVGARPEVHGRPAARAGPSELVALRAVLADARRCHSTRSCRRRRPAVGRSLRAAGAGPGSAARAGPGRAPRRPRRASRTRGPRGARAAPRARWSSCSCAYSISCLLAGRQRHALEQDLELGDLAGAHASQFLHGPGTETNV